MTVSNLNGVIDGKKVKIIINHNAERPEYFAKGKSGAELDTPRMYDYSGRVIPLEVHEDSADGLFWRPIDIQCWASGTLASGLNRFSNSRLSVVVLPTIDTGRGLVIDTTGSGLVVGVGSDQQQYLMAIGRFGEWHRKMPESNISGVQE